MTKENKQKQFNKNRSEEAAKAEVKDWGAEEEEVAEGEEES